MIGKININLPKIMNRYIKTAISYEDYFNNFPPYTNQKYKILSTFLSLSHNYHNHSYEQLNNIFPDENNIIFRQFGDSNLNYYILNKLNYILIKQSSSINDKSYCIPYRVDNQIQSIKNINEAKYLMSFIGFYESDPIRKKIPIYKKCYYEKTKNFWLCTQKEKELMRKNYINIMNDSKFILCPKGFATNSVRFFESIKTGRIPILISDNTKLPFDWIINYNKLIVKVPEKDIMNIMDYVKLFIKNNNLTHTSNELKEVYNKFISWNPLKHLEIILNNYSKQDEILFY